MPELKGLEKYLRAERMPFIWCPGCGNGIVLRAILSAIDTVGHTQDEVAVVSGIGCSSRASGYVDFNTLHTTHGRAIAFATGVKLAKPELCVIVVTGDGDATAIGGNHFIHAARRNIDITVVLFNNWIYGMTGGQLSPTTPTGSRATTASYGNLEQPFDISKLAVAAGASYVARAPVTSPLKLTRFVERGMRKRGFALIEAFAPCPTAFGRQNKLKTSVDNLEWIEEHTVDVQRASKMSAEDLDGKLLVGVLADVERPEYASMYLDLIQRLQAKGVAPKLPARETLVASECLACGEQI